MAFVEGEEKVTKKVRAVADVVSVYGCDGCHCRGAACLYLWGSACLLVWWGAACLLVCWGAAYSYLYRVLLALFTEVLVR